MAKIKKSNLKTPWARKTLARDTTTKRQARNIFLIFCEGENTEPEYFRAFRVNTETLIEVVGLGMSRSALVRHILRQADERGFLTGQRNHDPDRQIWCVFDRDTRGIDGEDEDFDMAVKLALTNGLRVAWSNDCFELWFFLHDHYVENRLSRTHYFKHLSERLKCNYEKAGKGKRISQSLYQLHLERQEQAIRNARRLAEFHAQAPLPSQRNPCTMVHELVVELNACLKR